MSIVTVAFFNNKGGVGKTSLLYHLSWALNDLGINTLASDFDPQANLTAAFLDDESLEKLWPDGTHTQTIFSAVQPFIKGIGDIKTPIIHSIDDHLSLLAGDLLLSSFEDQLSEVWPKCSDGDERAFRVMSAFWRITQDAAKQADAQIALMDLGPNLGAINRAAMISADFVVFPVAPDLFSLQGFKNIGPTLTQWRKSWQDRLPKNPDPELMLPRGKMIPAGYVVLQHAVRLNRPAKAYTSWIDRIPPYYRQFVRLEEQSNTEGLSFGNDPYCLALIKNYRSLMPLAQEARKPIFHLKPADGAIGAHLQAAAEAGNDFKKLAHKLLAVIERQSS